MPDKGWIWKKIEDFVKGDMVHRWGDDLPILDVQISQNGRVTLTYLDTDGIEKTVEGKVGSRYISRINET